ncbi:MAG TPA: peptidase S41, partial [Alphaproteobacteria bacterium]|nr:peptidase S41 [Alphaproteobacteria bacterium]
IQAKGIEPDIEVQQAKIESLGPDVSRHESDLPGALSNPDDANAPKTGEQPAKPGAAAAPDGNAAPAQAAGDQAPAMPEDTEPFVGSEKIQIARPSADYQLARALDLLRGLALLQKQAAN